MINSQKWGCWGKAHAYFNFIQYILPLGAPPKLFCLDIPSCGIRQMPVPANLSGDECLVLFQVFGVIYLISNLNIFLHVYWPFEFLPFQLPGHKCHPFFNWSIRSLFIDFKEKKFNKFQSFYTSQFNPICIANISLTHFEICLLTQFTAFGMFAAMLRDLKFLCSQLFLLGRWIVWHYKEDILQPKIIKISIFSIILLWFHISQFALWIHLENLSMNG